MYNISEKEIKRLRNQFIPGFFKLKIFNKLGIENILYNYEDMTEVFKLPSKKYLLDLILLYLEEKVASFFKTFTIKDDSDIEFLRKMLMFNFDLRDLIISNVSTNVINELILKNVTFVSNLYDIRKNDINSLLDISIKSNTYKQYIKPLSVPEEMLGYIISRLDIETLIKEMADSFNYTLINCIKKYRSEDISNYVLKNTNNVSELKELLKLDLPDSTCKILFEKHPLNNDIISFIYLEGNINLRKFIFSEYKDKIDKWEDYLIENDSYLEILNNSSEEIIENVIKKLSFEQIENLLKTRKYTWFYAFRKILFQIREDEIVEILVEQISNNPLSLSDFLSSAITDKIFNRVFERVNIDEAFIKEILESKKETLIEFIYKKYKSEVLRIISEEKGNREQYINKYLREYSYPLILQEELLKDLTNEEIIYILENTIFSKDLKNSLYKLYKNTIIREYQKLLVSDLNRAKELFIKCSSTDFREYLIENLDFNNLWLLLQELSYIETETLYKRFPKEIIYNLEKDYRKSPIDFVREVFYNPSDVINDVALDIISYDDVILTLKNGVILNGCIYSNKKTQKLLNNSVKNKAKEIKKMPYSECLLFLKGLRKNFDNLFIVFLENIELDDEFLHKLFIERGLSDKQKSILFKMKRNDIFRIVKDNLDNKKIDPAEYLQKGTPEEILNLVLPKIDKDRLSKLVNDPNFVNRRSVGENFALKLIVNTYTNKDNQAMVLELVKCYLNNHFELVKNFEKIQAFLKLNNIDIPRFWQYSLNLNYNYVPDIVKIYENDIEEFLNIKNILFSYIYDKNSKYSYKDFLDFVKNYLRYKDLCKSLALEELEFINFDKIKLLFKQNKTISGINSYEDCDNIISTIKDDYLIRMKNCTKLEDYKDLILQISFNCDTTGALGMLSNYGGVCELLQLKFYNLHNPEVLKKIDEVINYTELIEDIVNCEDINVLAQMLDDTIINLNSILTDFNFKNYEELMRELYAIEMDYNLSKIGYNVLENKVKLEDESKKYGVDVYDFRDKQYTLLAHVISSSENIDNLVNGVASGKQNFISLSAISHRMQAYYYDACNTIFGFDEMPYDNFICSSNDNMGTNGGIVKNSVEVAPLIRSQRGVLEISDAHGNSEILSLREGMKPKYIICPGREPSDEEIKIALKYNLKIILTQPVNKAIPSPINVREEVELKPAVSKEYLIEFRNRVISVKNKDKIAVLTDAHGLFEPTLTALEDIRKKGITKIYSLGDNIGTGSNPSEVIDLLNHYGVKSVKGNHELYLINGVAAYQKHLIETGAYPEEAANTKWTLDNLSQDQIEIISNYDDYIELNIGGKKVLLCHYLYDYNNGNLLYDISKYDLIIQGHKHFANINDKIITLKAIGIGNSKSNDKGKATYMIINEDLSYEFVNVPYAYKNTINDANVSDNNCSQKIMKWIGK